MFSFFRYCIVFYMCFSSILVAVCPFVAYQNEWMNEWSSGQRSTLVDGSLESPCRVLVKYIIKLLFLCLTVQALQGKMCQNSLPSGVGRSLGAKISGGSGRPWGIFFGFYKTRHILLSKGANCIVLLAVVLTQYRRVTDGRTDGQTELL